MIRTSAVRLFVIVATALAAALALPSRAFAGTLQIRDDAHVLSVDDGARLRSVVAGAPFDARLVFTSEYADGPELARYVGSLVDEPNTMIVGVDPLHHHVQVHFGRGSGIARPAWPAVERAGNIAFRDGDWAGGAAAIFRTAASAVTELPGAPAPAARAPSAVGSGLMLLLIVGGVIALVALFARRRSPYGPVQGGYGPPYGGGYGAGPYAGGPYPPSPGGLGPVGGGLIGAGLGGLAGYELGKLEGERERGTDERVRDQAPTAADDFDGGGGGSSWDDGGGDGGGFDGGGDSGGGSDF